MGDIDEHTRHGPSPTYSAATTSGIHDTRLRLTVSDPSHWLSLEISISCRGVRVYYCTELPLDPSLLQHSSQDVPRRARTPSQRKPVTGTRTLPWRLPSILAYLSRRLVHFLYFQLTCLSIRVSHAHARPVGRPINHARAQLTPHLLRSGKRRLGPCLNRV